MKASYKPTRVTVPADPALTAGDTYERPTLSTPIAVRRLTECLDAPESNTPCEPSRLQTVGWSVQLTVQAH